MHLFLSLSIVMIIQNKQENLTSSVTVIQTTLTQQNLIKCLIKFLILHFVNVKKIANIWKQYWLYIYSKAPRQGVNIGTIKSFAVLKHSKCRNHGVKYPWALCLLKKYHTLRVDL